MIDGITIAGNIIVDKNKYIKKYPAEGTLAHIDKVETTFGGCVCNTAANLAQIKPDFPIFADGVVGNEAEGKSVLDFFRDFGIDSTQVLIEEGQTSVVDAIINTTDHTRTFFANLGINSKYGSKGITCKTKHLHLGYLLLLPYLDEIVGGEPRLVPLLKDLRNKGIKISVDLVSDEGNRYKDVVVPILPYVDYIIINEIEASRITGIEVINNNRLNVESLKKAMISLKELGIKELVVIHAPEIGLIYDGKNFTELSSLEIPGEIIQSSVGAGDGFCAGILYGIIKKLSYLDMLRIASCLAVCVLMSRRPQSEISGIDNILKLEENYGRRKYVSQSK